jgi:starch synthase
MSDRLKVLFLAAEAAPFVKVGGLADVAGALPPALKQLPESPDIRMVIPMHRQIDLTKIPRAQVSKFEIPNASGPIKATAYETELEGVPVYLIDGAPIRDASLVYTSDTLADGHKYTFFSLAALELCRQLEWQPDILHAHDWHTAVTVYAIRTKFKEDPVFSETKTLLTVHNLPYLGNGAGPAVIKFGIEPAENSALPWWAQDMPLPMGLLKVDKINTVSKGYVQEMLTEPYGSGLHEFLATRKKDLIGILNGIDITRWDPATDSSLEANFSIKSLTPRRTNKRTLLKEVGLAPDVNRPLLAFIGRMDHQKGIDIALEALRQITDADWQAIILGSGDPEIENWTRQLAAQFPDRVHAAIRYDENFSRRIYGGADMMMIPSRYEPCGLIQMSAMRYGCVPVARATGGLRDTIIDYDAGKNSTGFLFEHTNPDEMGDALRRAIAAYADRRRWPYLQKRGMKQDFSWDKSAAVYYRTYTKMLK